MARATVNFTWVVTSRIVIGAGRTRVMSWAAAEVIIDPANRMVGSMRGASDSKLNGKSGEG